MKIKPDTYYKARNGEKAYIVSIMRKDENAKYPVLGQVTWKDRKGQVLWIAETWKLNGRADDTRKTEWDLVEEWREPKPIDWSDKAYKAKILDWQSGRYKTDGDVNTLIVEDFNTCKPVAVIPLKDIRKPDGTPLCEGDGL